jgi:hypothetical protein
MLLIKKLIACITWHVVAMHHFHLVCMHAASASTPLASLTRVQSSLCNSQSFCRRQNGGSDATHNHNHITEQSKQ